MTPDVSPADPGPSDEDVARPDTVNPGAAMQVDDLPLELDTASFQTTARTDEGSSAFIPPNLIEGDPRTAQAIDVSGVGEAERQESMTASAGEQGAFAPQSDPLPSDSTRGQILDIRAIPMEGQRVRYALEADVEAQDYDGVTAGSLPDWPVVVPAPVNRDAVDPRHRDSVRAYFDRAPDADP
jgi:hypothetical protein